MIKNILRIVLLGVCVLAISTTTAQEVQNTDETVKVKKKVPKFIRMDTNTDNKISLEEYNKHRIEMRAKKGKEPKKEGFSRRFKQIDLDKDGFLSKEEFKNRKETKPVKKKSEKS